VQNNTGPLGDPVIMAFSIHPFSNYELTYAYETLFSEQCIQYEQPV